MVERQEGGCESGCVFTGIWMRDSTGWIVGCRAEFVLIDLDVINDWFWNASKAGVLSVLEGGLET